MAVKKIYSFFGSPGAGKGTLAQLCAQNLNFEILSVGSLCRQQVLLNTDIGKKIDKALKCNSLIDDKLILSMVNDWVLSNLMSTEVLILDGFPRTIMQVDLFKSFLNRYLPVVEFLIFDFEISQKLAFKRVNARLICSNINCFKIALQSEVGSICKFCGSGLEKRADDNERILNNRLEKFFRHKRKLLSYYLDIGLPVEILNVENKNINELFNYFAKKYCGTKKGLIGG